MKIFVIIFSILLFLGNSLFAAVIITKNGTNFDAKSITDKQGNEILLAISKNGSTILIPFSEISTISILNVLDKNVSSKIIYKDGTEDIVSLPSDYVFLIDGKKYVIDKLTTLAFDAQSTLSASKDKSSSQSDQALLVEISSSSEITNQSSSSIVSENDENVSLFSNTESDSNLQSNNDTVGVLDKDTMMTQKNENESVSGVKKTNKDSILLTNSNNNELKENQEVSSINNLDIVAKNDQQKILSSSDKNDNVSVVKEPNKDSILSINSNKNELKESPEVLDTNNVVGVAKNEQKNIDSNVVLDEQNRNTKIKKEIVAAKDIDKKGSSENNYIVKKFDTLWDLAEKFLNNPYNWSLIWKNNDYIKNPDLIYPGDIIIMPSIYKEKQSIMYNENLANNKTKLDDRLLKIPSSKTGMLLSINDLSMFIHEKQNVDTSDVVKDDSVKNENLFELIKNERYPQFFSYGFYSKLGEFVENAKYQGEGELYSRGADYKGAFLKYYSQVRINLGKDNGVKPGDKYYVIETNSKMKDKKNKKSLPTYVEKKGEVKVEKVFKNYSVGFITRYFGKNRMIYNHDRIMKKQKIIVPRIKKIVFDSKNYDMNISTVVNHFGDNISFPFDVFIADKGSNQGIKTGQLYEIYTREKDKQFSDLPVGEAVVIKTFKNYSLIMPDIRWKRSKLKYGDKLVYKMSFEFLKENQK